MTEYCPYRILEWKQMSPSCLGVQAGMVARGHLVSPSVLLHFHQHMPLSFGMAFLLLPGTGEGEGKGLTRRLSF